jgi:hypothetical protein
MDYFFFCALSSIIKLEDINHELLQFEENLMSEIRKNNPEIFDQIEFTQNYLIESTLKFIILRYNQAIDKGIGIQELFKSIEKKSVDGNKKYASVFDIISLNLTKGLAPSIKDVQLATNYFNNNSIEKTDRVTKIGSIPNIDLNVLRQMVEWDSRMKILTNGERTYIADLAYELKPLNQFHKKNAEKHLQTLLKAGFMLK